MDKMSEKVIKRIIIYILLLFLLIGMIWGKRIRRAILSHRITHNLESQYNTKFCCDSLITSGGGVEFVCHPKEDESLLFDGFGDSTTGSISYDTYPGAIIAREDTSIFSDLLSDTFTDFYVYEKPKHRGEYLVYQIISKGKFTIDELHRNVYTPDLFFYVFINDSINLEYGDEYDSLKQASSMMAEIYEEKYNQPISISMHIYYVDAGMTDYIEEYFINHMFVDDEFEEEIMPNGMIRIQMGSDDGYYYESLRITKEEYINERERMR